MVERWLCRRRRWQFVCEKCNSNDSSRWIDHIEQTHIRTDKVLSRMQATRVKQQQPKRQRYRLSDEWSTNWTAKSFSQLSDNWFKIAFDCNFYGRIETNRSLSQRSITILRLSLSCSRSNRFNRIIFLVRWLQIFTVFHFFVSFQLFIFLSSISSGIFYEIELR